ncbi:MAG: hypothetical protein ACRD1L_13235, partial [Terriglobales bacterium]
ALDEKLLALVGSYPDPRLASTYEKRLRLVVNRARARFGSWYEMFPRSQGMVPGRSATFAESEARLPEIAAMGFDVVYLPPIHPIGRTHRKGRNNALRAAPGDPGSPYAIGSEAGGHDAIEPGLGTLAGFDRFVAACARHGLEVALDFAVNCSPDHPYVRQHPEWFFHRPDGTIKYAENPPKRYEDIYPLNFEGPEADRGDRAVLPAGNLGASRPRNSAGANACVCAPGERSRRGPGDAQRWLGAEGPQASASISGARAAGALGPAPTEALARELERVLRFWAGHGVRIFRVDNPHTKPFAFWQRLLAALRATDPDLVFLSEAFTRPKPMKRLAKLGFSQSYTYFTWRNSKQELTEYLTELALGPGREYFRPNFFVNTPDILPPILQRGGRPAFLMRLVLAATLAPSWGMYNGFELCENRALPGTEEYQDSEKYEFKVWDWDRPGHIKDWVARLNQIRRAHPALHRIEGLRFLPAANDQMLFYGRFTPDFSDLLVIGVCLDPHRVQEGPVEIPGPELGLGDAFEVEDLLAGPRGIWRGRHHYLRLDPAQMPAAILRLRPA